MLQPARLARIEYVRPAGRRVDPLEAGDVDEGATDAPTRAPPDRSIVAAARSCCQLSATETSAVELPATVVSGTVAENWPVRSSTSPLRPPCSANPPLGAGAACAAARASGPQHRWHWPAGRPQRRGEQGERDQGDHGGPDEAGGAGGEARTVTADPFRSSECSVADAAQCLADLVDEGDATAGGPGDLGLGQRRLHDAAGQAAGDLDRNQASACRDRAGRRGAACTTPAPTKAALARVCPFEEVHRRGRRPHPRSDRALRTPGGRVRHGEVGEYGVQREVGPGERDGDIDPLARPQLAVGGQRVRPKIGG